MSIPHYAGYPNQKISLTSGTGAKDKTRQSQTVIERLKYIKPGKNSWPEDIPQNLRLNVKGAKLSNIYNHLDPKNQYIQSLVVVEPICIIGKKIGMAVPPDGMAVIFKVLLSCFAGVHYITI